MHKYISLGEYDGVRTTPAVADKYLLAEAWKCVFAQCIGDRSWRNKPHRVGNNDPGPCPSPSARGLSPGGGLRSTERFFYLFLKKRRREKGTGGLVKGSHSFAAVKWPVAKGWKGGLHGPSRLHNLSYKFGGAATCCFIVTPRMCTRRRVYKLPFSSTSTANARTITSPYCCGLLVSSGTRFWRSRRV